GGDGPSGERGPGRAPPLPLGAGKDFTGQTQRGPDALQALGGGIEAGLEFFQAADAGHQVGVGRPVVAALDLQVLGQDLGTLAQLGLGLARPDPTPPDQLAEPASPAPGPDRDRLANPQHRPGPVALAATVAGAGAVRAVIVQFERVAHILARSRLRQAPDPDLDTSGPE